MSAPDDMAKTLDQMAEMVEQLKKSYFASGGRGFDPNEIEERMGDCDELSGLVGWVWSNYERYCGERIQQSREYWREAEAEQRAERAEARMDQV